MWQSVKDKPAPVLHKQTVLCAWQPDKKAGRWTYDVLTHWPDGAWTDACENLIEQEEIPDYWEAISQPYSAQLTLDITAAGKSGRTDSPPGSS